MIKKIIEWIILVSIWILFWIGVFQLFISSFFWNIKNIDYISLNWDNSIKIVEKPVLIIKTETGITVNDWITQNDIKNIFTEEDKKTNITNNEKIPNEYELKIEDLISKNNKYNGWYFINELDNIGVEWMKLETLTFNNGKIVPVVQSIWWNVPFEEIWRTYLNTDLIYLNKSKNLRAFVLYAHSNYWKWWVEVWEDLLKVKENETLTLWNKKIKITKIETKYDNNLEFNKILSDYWNNEYDVIFYTCYKIDWKYLWKKFYLWKVVK